MAREARIVLSRFPWVIRIFGLVFAGVPLVLCVMMLMGRGELTVSGDDDGRGGRPATPADAWAPGIFAAIGLGLALIRYQRVVIASRRALVREVGWGPWVRRRETPLDEVISIDVREAESRGSGSGSYPVVPVVAVGRSGEHELTAPTQPAEARALARRIALAFGLPSGVHASRGGASSVVEVLTQPLARGMVTEQELRPPPGTRVRLEELPRGGVALVVPALRPVRSALGVVLPLLLAGLFWLLILYPLPSGGEHELPYRLATAVTLGLAAIATVIMALNAWHRDRFGCRLVVDSERTLRIRTRRIAAERIRAIVVVPGDDGKDGIEVVLADGAVFAAGGQSAGDLQWMRAVLIERLTRG